MRYILFSDTHGKPQLIKNILNHCSFDVTKDKIIYLGDFCDRGEHSEECFNLLVENDADFIIGNHEFAHLFNMEISPYDYNLDNTEVFKDYLKLMADGRVKLVDSIDGYLISHAGIGSEFFYEVGKDTISEFVDEVNKFIFESVDFARTIVVGEGPLWFRPSSFIEVHNVPQIFGHTHSKYFTKDFNSNLKENNIYAIDPGSTQYDYDTNATGKYIILNNGFLEYYNDTV